MVAGTCHESENPDSEDSLPEEPNADSVTEPDMLNEGIIQPDNKHMSVL